MKLITRLQSYFGLKTIALLFALISLNSFSQQNGIIRCHTVHMDSVRHANYPETQSNQQFEEWIAKELEAKRSKGETQLIINGVYQIPVIVHVIHNGEAIGSGTNISAAAIQSQIDVLNEDFRKLVGTAGYNTHPYGADTKIEFCLAKRKPNGTAFATGEDGINRVNRNTQGWGAPPYSTTFIDATIKPWSTGTDLGGWNPAEYMNFWSINISGSILGYAQFPTTILGGMSCASQSVTTDGVVMLYSSIGKSSVTGFPGPYNEGRTATHEIGHWLGLRHIWGDGGCGVDDFCADTPLSDASNFGCPNTNSCTDPNGDPSDMVENYMDYTDDDCMNIFTYDQMARMRIVLESSPIRASLITSSACIPPNVSDASIINITKPSGDNCAGSIIPTVTIKNRGSSNLTSATISYRIDGGTATTFNWTGNIAPNNTANANLPAFTATLGIHTIKAYTTLPNGVIDPDPTYDTTELQFAVSNGFQPNYLQNFESGTFVPDVRWNVVNPNSDCYKWIGQSCTSNTGAYPNDAAMMPNFGNASSQDEYLYTPFFILPCNATTAQVIFDKAYQRRATGSTDRLRLQMSTDCGATWTTTLYDQNGIGLQSNTTVSNTYWIPSAAGDWDNVVINLMPYVTGTSQSVQFRFRGTNAGNGGNVYVDNFQFNAVTPGEAELAQGATNILDGGFINIGTAPLGSPTNFVFTISNPGTSNLTLTGPISIVGASQFTLNSTFGTTTVPAGGSTTFSIDFTPNGAGPFTATVSFGTNDCDEGTYNFQITGSGSVTPPVANFIGDPTTICQGSTVTYTDASTSASSWAWTFTGGTPASATGVGPHTVTYNTAGTFNSQLVVTNAFGSDPELKTNYITVIAGTGAALPITQGFTLTTFPPAGWSINNGGLAGTWIRSATQGTAPTAGNSAVINNFTTNTTGNIDDLVMIPANFTGLTSAQLQFDVAYARYSATYSDQLQVVVSSDCGQTFDVVYDKAGSTLATDADQTGGYTAPATWRQETIDLSAFVGSGKVDIYFRSISGWGQYLYIDNVNLTGVISSATANYTALPSPTCIGQTVTFTNTSTGATSWNWNFGAGATPATATGAGPHSVTYSTSGTKTTSLSINSGASVSNQNVVITPTPSTPTFSAGSATTFCTGGSVTLTSSSATGNQWSLNGTPIGGATGQTHVASVSGNYTVMVTTSGCPSASSAATTVTVNATPATPTISAGSATTFCTGGSVTLTSSSATGNQWSLNGTPIGGATGQTHVASTAGNYTVMVTTSGCPSASSAATTVTVNATPATPTISAGSATTFCTGGSVTLTSSSATGNQWSLNGTTIGGATGQTHVASVSGNYTVMVTTSSCPSASSAATTVTVNPNPVITLGTVTNPSACATATGSIQVNGSATGVVSWTGTATGNSGSVTLPYTITGLATGTYNITITANTCTSNTLVQGLTDPSAPATPTISAGSATTFCDGGSVTLTSSSATGNQWSLNGTPIGGATGQTHVASVSGNYTVVVVSGGCTSSASSATTVTVNPTPVITIGTVTNPSTCATATGSIQVNGSTTGIVSWTGTSSGNSGTVTLPYVVTGLAAGSYTISISAGTCTSNVLVQGLNDPSAPVTPSVSASGSTTFCTGGSVSLTSSSATGNQWFFNGTPIGGATGQTYIPMTSGNYSVNTTAGACTSSTSSVTTVTVNPNPTAPIVTTSGSTAICLGSSVTLNSSQPTGNLWSDGQSESSISVNTAGIYTVTYTDGNGCSATTSGVEVTVNALPSAPTITAGGPLTFCSGSSVDLTSSYSGGNLWSTNSPTNMITVHMAGSYTVTHTDANGCSATSAATSVIVNALPTVSFANMGTVCEYNDPITLSGGTPAGGTYSGIAVVGGEFNPGTAGFGNHTLTYTFTDGNSCTNSSTSDVLVDDCAAIEELADNVITVFPNPTFGMVNIVSDIKAIESVRIFDAAGRLVHQLNGNSANSITIDMIEFAEGVYNFEIQIGETIHRERIIRN